MPSRSAPRRALTWLLLLVVLYLIFRAAPILVADRVFQHDDFPEYWSAGRLNLGGLNPYDPQLMDAVQRDLGRTESVLMYNPPYALTLAMPLSVLSYPLARVVWFLVNMLCVAVAVAWLWDLAGGPRSRLWLIWILAFFFSPVLDSLQKGQISPFMLLGLAGFLRYQKAERYWVAGAFAALTALKPHWMLLFWLALLFWSIARRRWEVLLAAAGVLVAATGVALIFNGAVLPQYLFTATHEAPLFWQTPTIGGALRAWVGPEKTWLQFLPVLLGILWTFDYWRRHRVGWQWVERLPVITSASVLSAMYGWTFDQVVLLVALVPALQTLTRATNRRSAFALGGLGLVINIVALARRGVVSYGAYWWLAPVWVVWRGLVWRLRVEIPAAPTGPDEIAPSH